MTKVRAKRVTKVARYGKADLLQASGFTKLEKDILNVVLDNDQEYSVDQAKQQIKKFKEAI
ncbi:hypothetical protein [Lactiplantibacillus plajomi]|uniref:Uncharacterized protein n=1 Tax=Lactiplantibacillus plajomi TaxID=1457217 RepID=A0ABV6K1M1_9LACO|nr:hypothetical protein [Lactiplantibacillus plajomi]